MEILWLAWITNWIRGGFMRSQGQQSNVIYGLLSVVPRRRNNPRRLGKVFSASVRTVWRPEILRINGCELERAAVNFRKTKQNAQERKQQHTKRTVSKTDSLIGKNARDKNCNSHEREIEDEWINRFPTLLIFGFKQFFTREYYFQGCSIYYG